ncbi:MAG: hypothetical protein J0L67_04145 [Cytophagales bacterium]|nr:hypothetical protein [Cytophagales bacterium]
MPLQNYYHSFKLLFALTILFLFENTYGQPIIPEDRMYLKVSPDVIKLEQDIYHPNFPGKKPAHFIRWMYSYSNGLLIAERAFPASDLTQLETEKLYEYTDAGKLIRDSTGYVLLPQLNSYSTYEYNSKGRVTKVVEMNSHSHAIIRVDTYGKYASANDYSKVSQFFGDDHKKSIRYTSLYERGQKQAILFENGFSTQYYKYDSVGRLVEKNNRTYFYKLDDRGNAIAVVQIERGMRIYNFIRNTYVDGTVTGSLELDENFIQEWDNQK